jgi:hypothetical protein
MTTTHVRAQTYNPGAGTDHAKLADLQSYVDAGATFILGQEFGDREALVLLFLEANPTWRVLWEDATNNGRKNPIFYDRRQAKRVWWSLVIVWLSSYLGPKGAGPDKGQTKRLNRARFRLTGNGARVKVLNLHATVSAFSTTGPEGDRRKRAWRQEVRAFFVEVGRSLARTFVIGGGDFNADKPLMAVTTDGWSWDSEGPTFRQETPDHIGHRKAHGISVNSTGVEETDGSKNHDDHRSPWVAYSISA